MTGLQSIARQQAQRRGADDNSVLAGRRALREPRGLYGSRASGPRKGRRLHEESQMGNKMAWNTLAKAQDVRQNPHDKGVRR
jgi:hypothetical protein